LDKVAEKLYVPVAAVAESNWPEAVLLGLAWDPKVN
jgi:hypothetical protein